MTQRLFRRLRCFLHGHKLKTLKYGSKIRLACDRCPDPHAHTASERLTELRLWLKDLLSWRPGRSSDDEMPF
ncbi:MAG TPA: hypothetical protein V6D06_18325 [Trichocoleus sp.]